LSKENNYRRFSDEELVKAILEGDTDAYTEVMSRYKNMVYSVILHILSGDGDAEDIAQETFIDGFFRLGSLRDNTSLAPWLYGIAKRKALNHYTRRKHYVSYDSIEEGITGLPTGNSPEDYVIKNETACLVRKAISELSDKNRSVALLYYFENMPVSDIANRLGVSVGTVKSRLHEARNKLKGGLAFMTENNNQTNTQSKRNEDFDKMLRAKLKQLEYYYALNGASFEGFDALLAEAEKLAGMLPESAEKQAVLADVYLMQAYQENEDPVIMEKAKDAAEKGSNAKVIASLLVDKILATDDDDNEGKLRIIDEEAIPKLKALGAVNEQGSLMFWRGAANVRLKNLEEARSDFEECVRLCNEDEVYRACALCGIKNLKLAIENTDDPTMGISVVSETCMKKDGKLIFVSQPGFSTPPVLYEKHKWDSLHYYVSLAGRLFYDLSMSVGQSYTDASGTTLTLVSMDAVAQTPAGIFKSCMHVRCTAEDCVSDAWYEKDVGLVKATFTEENGDTESYLLDEYNIVGGNGYFPFGVGNRWHYVNPDLPDYLYQCIEYEIVWTDGERATLSTLSYVNFRKNYEQCCALDSDYYIGQGEQLCGVWKLDEAVEALSQAVRVNTNQTATFAALNGIEALSRFSEYHKKGWRFCPSSINTGYIRAKENSSVYHYGENALYTFSPYRFGSRGEENRIFGVKPFRYLQRILGCMYDKKWVIGYTETKDLGDNITANVSVTEGGTVTTAAGVFADTIKLTVVCEKAGMDDGYYMKHNYQYTFCGTKEYWFAKGVGLVRFRCIWGKSLDSTAELVSFKVPAADSSYMPIQIGNTWEYDEINLTKEGYIAKRFMRVDCGINDNFIISDNQEFIFKGTEEEYEAFKASLK